MKEPSVVTYKTLAQKFKVLDGWDRQRKNIDLFSYDQFLRCSVCGGIVVYPICTAIINLNKI